MLPCCGPVACAGVFVVAAEGGSGACRAQRAAPRRRRRHTAPPQPGVRSRDPHETHQDEADGQGANGGAQGVEAVEQTDAVGEVGLRAGQISYQKGSVAPINIVGSDRIASDSATIRGRRSGDSRSSIGASQPTHIDQCDRNAVTAR